MLQALSTWPASRLHGHAGTATIGFQELRELPTNIPASPSSTCNRIVLQVLTQRTDRNHYRGPLTVHAMYSRSTSSAGSEGRFHMAFVFFRPKISVLIDDLRDARKPTLTMNAAAIDRV